MKQILASLMMLIATTVSAQTITAIVTMPPGSGVDNNARQIMKQFDERYGTTTTVINRPGGDGVVGMAYFSELQDRSIKLLFPSTGHVVGLSSAELDRWSPVIALTKQPFMLMVRKNFPANNWAEFVEYARANPGKVNTGTGARAMFFPMLDIFEKRNGYTTNWIAYSGNGRPDLDVASGTLDTSWNIAPLALNPALADRVKILTVASVDSVAGADAALSRGKDTGSMYLIQGVFVSSNTDAAVRQQLNQQFNEILRSDWAQQTWQPKGIKAVGGTAQAFDAFVKQHHSIWQRMK